jgi:microcystin degradation protein MlrC
MTHAVNQNEAREALQEVVELLKAKGMQLSHEDGHGAFIIEPYSDNNGCCGPGNSAWILQARIENIAK